MKAAIHPEVFQDAKTTCSNCGTVFPIASTIKEQTVETCSHCHPVFTGKKQTDRRGGRIDRFKKRQEASQAKKAA